MSIGVFDSGVGGITFLKRGIELLPNESFTYYADQKHAPYGTKPKEEVYQYVFEAVNFLNKKEIKALVIACNTATSVAVRALREEFDFPIIGMEPAVKPAVLIDDPRRVLVLATALTLREEKLNRLLDRIDAKDKVDLLALSSLVEFAENHMFDESIVKKYLKEALAAYDLNQYKGIVLGCTHFPFYKHYIEDLVPDHVQVLDGNCGTAKHLKEVLIEKGLIELGDKPKSVTFYSSNKEAFEAPELNRYIEYLDRVSY